MPGTFRVAKPDKVIEYRTSVLPILGFDKRVIKGIFNRLNRPRTKDLELSEVAVIEGFYINIILEACLLKVDI